MRFVRREGEVRRFGEAELDEGGAVVDDREGEDVERGEGVRQEGIRHAVEPGHLAGIHLRVHRHEEVDVGLVQEVEVLERRGDAGLELGDQVLEAVLVGRGRPEVERDGLQRRLAAREEGFV